MLNEKYYREEFQFQLREGWGGDGYLVLTHDSLFGSIRSRKFTQGFLNNDFACLFNSDFILEDEDIKLIELLIKKSIRNKEEFKND